MTETIHKILYVDDETDIGYIVEFILQNGGLDIKTLSDSTMAEKELLDGDYSLLILDLMMPNMNGFQVLENVRRISKLENMPILILSSKQLTNSETEFLSQNNAYVMAKPFEPSRLLEKVREILKD